MDTPHRNFQRAIMSGDEKQLSELIIVYGKPRKPISPLIFLKNDKEKELDDIGGESSNNG